MICFYYTENEIVDDLLNIIFKLKKNGGFGHGGGGNSLYFRQYYCSTLDKEY